MHGPEQRQALVQAVMDAVTEYVEGLRREIEARKQPCCDEHGLGRCECLYFEAVAEPARALLDRARELAASPEQG